MKRIYSSTDSWGLKFKRAQFHMAEIRNIVRLYANAHPYRISRVKNPKTKSRRRWRYKLTLDSIDPMLAMALGDFVHNLRTALDHVAVTNTAPRYRSNATCWPIETRDLFALDDQWQFIHPASDARERYMGAVKGMHFLGKTVIVDSQPYASANPHTHVIGILSRLDNRDKHKKLIGIEPALRGSIYIFARGVLYRTVTLGDKHFYYDNAEVYTITLREGHTLRDSEVNVECSGPASITLKVSGVEGKVGDLELSLTKFMLVALGTVRLLLRAMDGAARLNAAEWARVHGAPAA
jgi:hypothetical protein